MQCTLTIASLILLSACSYKAREENAVVNDTTTTMTVPPIPMTQETSMTKDIIETAVSAGTFNTLAKALTEAGLVETLKGAGPFTVLAPTDEAFAKIPANDLNALLADKESLAAVLRYHVISGNVPSSQVTTMVARSRRNKPQ